MEVQCSEFYLYVYPSTPHLKEYCICLGRHGGWQLMNEMSLQKLTTSCNIVGMMAPYIKIMYEFGVDLCVTFLSCQIRPMSNVNELIPHKIACLI